jgi:hypothetical protein
MCERYRAGGRFAPARAWRPGTNREGARGDPSGNRANRVRRLALRSAVPPVTLGTSDAPLAWLQAPRHL